MSFNRPRNRIVIAGSARVHEGPPTTTRDLAPAVGRAGRAPVGSARMQFRYLLHTQLQQPYAGVLQLDRVASKLREYLPAEDARPPFATNAPCYLGRHARADARSAAAADARIVLLGRLSSCSAPSAPASQLQPDGWPRPNLPQRNARYVYECSGTVVRTANSWQFTSLLRRLCKRCSTICGLHFRAHASCASEYIPFVTSLLSRGW